MKNNQNSFVTIVLSFGASIALLFAIFFLFKWQQAQFKVEELKIEMQGIQDTIEDLNEQLDFLEKDNEALRSNKTDEFYEIEDYSQDKTNKSL